MSSHRQPAQSPFSVHPADRSVKSALLVATDHHKSKVMDQLPRSNNQLALRLWGQITTDPATESNSVFVSPLSVSLAMLLVANGTKDGTKHELLRQLQVTDLMQMNQQVQEMMAALPIQMANSLWLHSSLQVRPTYVATIQSCYRAEAKVLRSAEEINRWVYHATSGKIHRLVSDLPQDASVVLTNAIHFKAKWKHAFQKYATVAVPFFPGQAPATTCEMMSLSAVGGSASHKLQYCETPDLQAVALPYESIVTTARPLEAVVVLPKRVDSFQNSNVAFEKVLTDLNWSQPREGTLELPRFRVETKIETLKSNLKQLGFQQLFRDSMDMDPLVNNIPSVGMAISDVIQKVVVEVSEEGAEAPRSPNFTGTPAVAMTPPSARFHMRCDRPFYFLVVDKQTQLILFLGHVKKPGQTSATITAVPNQTPASLINSVSKTGQQGSTSPDASDRQISAVNKSPAAKPATGIAASKQTIEDNTKFGWSDNLPPTARDRLRRHPDQLDCAFLTTILNVDGIPLLQRASTAIASYPTTLMASEAAIENDLAGAFGVIHFASSHWLRLAGTPFAHGYYNLACIHALVVELYLGVLLVEAKRLRHPPVLHFGSSVPEVSVRDVVLEKVNEPSKDIAVGRCIPVAPGGDSSLGTVGEWINARLDAAETCLKVALAAGYNDIQNLLNDRDFTALRQLRADTFPQSVVGEGNVESKTESND